MKKEILKLIILIILAAVLLALAFAFGNIFRSPGPPISNELGKNQPQSINTTGIALNLPAGFSIEVFARDLPGVRVMVRDGLGNFWVSQPSEGMVSLVTVEDGRVTRSDAVFRGLNRPHGLAIDHQNPFTLYVAETDKISRVTIYSDDTLEKIIDLPAGGRHFTRTIAFGPDDRLYVSIGSSCDTCVEDDPRLAAIYSMNPVRSSTKFEEGRNSKGEAGFASKQSSTNVSEQASNGVNRDSSDFKEYAKGLRNAVFFDWSYVDGRMWATEMGRDHLGDDLPPDEINIIKEGKVYGWPYCYGKQVRDTTFEPRTNFDCSKTEPSTIDLEAHSAPLGLAFVPEEGWPEEYWYDLLVAYHGSWNRTVPTGYKIVRIPLDERGRQEGLIEDFISGWLTDTGSVLGRPVDIIVEPGGMMYISDDRAGVIYRGAFHR